MNEVTAAIEEILNEAKAIIIDKMSVPQSELHPKTPSQRSFSDPTTATGRTVDSLFIEVSGNHGVLVGGSWFADVERGHPDGKKVNEFELEEWAKSRNIAISVPAGTPVDQNERSEWAEEFKMQRGMPPNPTKLRKANIPKLAARLEALGSYDYQASGRYVFSPALDDFLQKIPDRITNATANYIVRFVCEDSGTNDFFNDEDVPF